MRLLKRLLTSPASRPRRAQGFFGSARYHGDTPLLIFGTGSYAHWLAQALTSAGCTVAGLIGQPPPESGASWKYFSMEQVRRQFPHLPVVLAPDYPFSLHGIPAPTLQTQAKCIELLRKALDAGLANPLLHSAALSESFDIDWTGGVLLFGVQGSGNTVYSHIIQQILQDRHKRLPRTNNPARFFSAMRQESIELLYNHCLEGLQAIGATQVGIAPGTEVGHVALNVHFENGGIASITGFPGYGEQYSYVYGYHDFPTPEACRRLKAQGWKLIGITRNPADMINSFFRKTAQWYGRDHEEALADLPFFEEQCSLHIQILRENLPALCECAVFRYRDLILSPVQTVQALGSALGYRLSEREAQEYWDLYGEKPLPNAPEGHFWNAQVGKWVDFYSDAHIRILQRHGLLQLVRDYGFVESAAELEKRLDELPADTRLPRGKVESRYRRNLEFTALPVADLKVMHTLDDYTFAKLEHWASDPMLRAVCRLGSTHDQPCPTPRAVKPAAAFAIALPLAEWLYQLDAWQPALAAI